jgi:hypothetical protein
VVRLGRPAEGGAGGEEATGEGRGVEAHPTVVMARCEVAVDYG